MAMSVRFVGVTINKPGLYGMTDTQKVNFQLTMFLIKLKVLRRNP